MSAIEDLIDFAERDDFRNKPGDAINQHNALADTIAELRAENGKLNDDVLWARRNTALAESVRDQYREIAGELADELTNCLNCPTHCRCTHRQALARWTEMEKGK